MPLLWNPIWVTPADFRAIRSYTDLIVVGWQDGFFVEVGNPFVLQEIPFGGYKFVCKFKDDWWNWQSSAWSLDSIFEDVYAIDWITGLPVNAGDVTVSWRNFVYPYFRSGIVLDMPALDNHYYWMDFPPAPADYWQQNGTPMPARPFITNPP